MSVRVEGAGAPGASAPPGGIIQQPEEAGDAPTATVAPESGFGNSLVIGEEVTMPTTHLFYKVSAIEILNGNVVAGNIILGAVILDAEPPVSNDMHIIAFTPSTVQVNTDTLQKVDTSASLMMAGGTRVTPFHIFSSGAATNRYFAVANQNIQKPGHGFEARLLIADGIAWTSQVRKVALRLYFVGYAP